MSEAIAVADMSGAALASIHRVNALPDVEAVDAASLADVDAYLVSVAAVLDLPDVDLPRGAVPLPPLLDVAVASLSAASPDGSAAAGCALVRAAMSDVAAGVLGSPAEFVESFMDVMNARALAVCRSCLS